MSPLKNYRAIVPIIRGMIKYRRLSHAPHKKVQEKLLLIAFPELGGDEEDRTLDLTDANRTLSQGVRKAGPFFRLGNCLSWVGDANHAAEGTRVVRNFFAFYNPSSVLHLIPDRQ